jgi:hypothetical protein
MASIHIYGKYKGWGWRLADLTLSYSSKINLFISSAGFSALEKNAVICFQSAILPIQSPQDTGVCGEIQI